MRKLDRRSFLQASAVAAGALAGGPAGRAVAATPMIEAPEVDRLVMRNVIDTNHDIFITGAQPHDVAVERVRRSAPDKRNRTLEGQWGLSLYLESAKGAETRRYLLDFGYTAEALNNNLDLLGIDVAPLDALILSHGHADHYGGLIGFLKQHRAAMRPDLKLYTGGEDVFCHRRIAEGDGKFTEGGVLDRRTLAEMRVETVLSETPLVIGGHAFTTGAVPRVSLEKVLPNTFVERGVKDGVGCDTSRYQGSVHFTAEELAGTPVPDQHWHEHATCYRIKGRGLVVITSCGHCGIINTLRRAQEVTGVEKVHALVGGFHLAPAQDPYLGQVMAELKKFDIDHVIPMHCSGSNFIEMAKREMPEKLVLCTTGSRFTFAA